MCANLAGLPYSLGRKEGKGFFLCKFEGSRNTSKKSFTITSRAGGGKEEATQLGTEKLGACAAKRDPPIILSQGGGRRGERKRKRKILTSNIRFGGKGKDAVAA